MKFKSNANFNKEPKTGSIFTLKDNSLGISIHKYAGCGDELFLNSKALSIYNYDLETEDFDEAVRKLSCVKLRKSEKMLTNSIQTQTLNLTDIRRTQNVNQKSG